MPKFRSIPQFTSSGNYRVNLAWEDLENTLRRYGNRGSGLGGLQMDPDFQRGHVWTREKQIAYVEYILRGGYSSKDIYWNNPTWQGSYKEDTLLVDGKQRLEAVRAFLRDEIPAFGCFYSEYEDGLPSHAEFVFNINNLQTRREVLQWYLDLNTGGVIHTEEELNKVRELLEAEGR